jgi:hypothetical protein
MVFSDIAHITAEPRRTFRAQPAGGAAHLAGAPGRGIASQRDLVIASLLRCPDRGSRERYAPVSRHW